MNTFRWMNRKNKARGDTWISFVRVHTWRHTVSWTVHRGKTALRMFTLRSKLQRNYTFQRTFSDPSEPWNAEGQHSQPCCHDTGAATSSKYHCVRLLQFAIGGRRQWTGLPTISNSRTLGLYGSYCYHRFPFCVICTKSCVRPHLSIPKLYQLIWMYLVIWGSTPKIKTTLVSISIASP